MRYNLGVRTTTRGHNIYQRGCKIINTMETQNKTSLLHKFMFSPDLLQFFSFFLVNYYKKEHSNKTRTKLSYMLRPSVEIQKILKYTLYLIQNEVFQLNISRFIQWLCLWLPAPLKNIFTLQSNQL